MAELLLELYSEEIPPQLQIGARTQLKEFVEKLPNQIDTMLGDRGARLSGGQKQRVAIARALVGKPKVILADEPTGALDSKTSYEVMGLLRELNNEGITMVVVTHENDIAEMCDRTINLHDGQIA